MSVRDVVVTVDHYWDARKKEAGIRFETIDGRVGVEVLTGDARQHRVDLCLAVDVPSRAVAYQCFTGQGGGIVELFGLQLDEGA